MGPKRSHIFLKVHRSYHQSRALLLSWFNGKSIEPYTDRHGVRSPPFDKTCGIQIYDYECPLLSVLVSLPGTIGCDNLFVCIFDSTSIFYSVPSDVCLSEVLVQYPHIGVLSAFNALVPLTPNDIVLDWPVFCVLEISRVYITMKLYYPGTSPTPNRHQVGMWSNFQSLIEHYPRQKKKRTVMAERMTNFVRFRKAGHMINLDSAFRISKIFQSSLHSIW